MSVRLPGAGRRLVTALLAGTALAVAAFTGASTATAQSTTHATRSGRAAPNWTGIGDIQWMINGSALPLISGQSGNDTLITNAFDNSRTNVMGQPPAGWSPPVNTTKTYESYASFKSAFAGIQPGSRVLYDIESWTLSAPDNTDPAAYMAEFVALAHSNPDPSKWLRVILAPALDIVHTMSCYQSGDKNWQNYLDDCQIPTLVARAAPDMFEVQAQYFENCTSAGVSGCNTTYAWFVQQAVSQAQSGDAGLTTLAGLSTNPGGATSSGQTLYTDSQNTQGSVSGYWLNVPVQSTFCPKCQPGGVPQVAVDYLHLLGYTG